MCNLPVRHSQNSQAQRFHHRVKHMKTFSLFFDDNLLQYIVDQTNAYAQKKLAAMQVKIFKIMYNVTCMFKHTSLNAVDITSVPLPELEVHHQGRDEGVSGCDSEHGDYSAERSEGLLVYILHH